MEEAKNLKIDLELPFASKTIAKIVYDVLRVDKEPIRSGVVRVLTLENTIVKVNFTASLVKQVRVALNNFLQKVDLIIETVQVVGPPVSKHYNHC